LWTPAEVFRLVRLLGGFFCFGAGVLLLAFGNDAHGTVSINIFSIAHGEISKASAGIYVIFFSMFVIATHRHNASIELAQLKVAEKLAQKSKPQASIEIVRSAPASKEEVVKEVSEALQEYYRQPWLKRPRNFRFAIAFVIIAFLEVLAILGKEQLPHGTTLWSTCDGAAGLGGLVLFFMTIALASGLVMNKDIGEE
jgi:hypothetical protein